MEEQLPSLLSAVVIDTLGFFKLPGGSVAGFSLAGALSKLVNRRLQAAREILLQELRSGEKQLPPNQIDEGVAIIYRYQRAAQEGAARLNLRLMAQTIAGKAHLGNLSADEFLQDADMIASLRREEILLLAKLHSASRSETPSKNKPAEESVDPMKWAESQLVPSVFRNREELEATAAAIVRTGLIKTESGYGAIHYSPTPLLDRLVARAPLEAAIAKENAG